MLNDDPIRIARGLIDRHRIRAGAVAEHQLEEARLAGDTAALEHWSAVAAAISELRRTVRRPTLH